VLAYSTISQLGYMFVGVGVGAYAAGIFHLTTHAFFKALLFLGAGSVIHGLHGEQDLRKMGGIAPRMLITTVTFLVGAVGLAGLPPFAGFFSKDEILAATFHHEGHRLLWAILLAGVFLTALYTARLVLLAFFGSPRMSKDQAHHIHESPAVMTAPLAVLALLTAVAGFVGVPSSHGTVFERFLAPVLPFKEAEHGGVASLALAAVSVIAALAGVFVAWLVYGRGQVDASKIGVPTNPVHKLLLNKYYVDEIYDALIVKPIYRLCLWCAQIFDVKVIDGLVNGVASAVVAWALGLRRIQTGYVMNYALGMLLGAVALVAFLLVARP
jgi:NADH-quinone oxidoreductase subunit L